MKKKLDLKMLENADIKTIEALSYKYRAVDDAEAEKIFRRITNDTEEYYEEAQEHKVEVYNRPIWRKALSAAASLAIVAGIATLGAHFYSQLKKGDDLNNNIASDAASSVFENTSAPVAITDDYKGAILGIGNWHIEKSPNYEYDNTMLVKFVNDDTGFEFASSECSEDRPFAYLADLDNDGTNELICNKVFGIFGGTTNDHAVIYRLRDGEIEAGIFYDNYEDFASEHDMDISSNVDFSDSFCPEENKIILKCRYSDTEYELGIEDYSFGPSFYSPLLVNYCFGNLFGINNWHIDTESVTSDTENTYFINDDTGEIFIEYTGYQNKTSAFLTDLNNDNFLELVCNYQYGDDQENMNDHVKIYRIIDGKLTCGEFLDDFEDFEKANNIVLGSCDDFSEVYDVDRNKIILKKQGEDNEYELGMEYYHFKPVEHKSSAERAESSELNTADTK